MNKEEIKNSIRAEIDQLQQILFLLEQLPGEGAVAPRAVSRAKGARSVEKPAELTLPRRQMSAEGKARIAAAQRKRWAASKKAAAVPRQKTAATGKRASKKTAKNSASALKKSTRPAAKKPAKAATKRPAKAAITALPTVE